MFRFGDAPWFSNARNAFDSAIHEFANAADSFADNIANSMLHPNAQQRNRGFHVGMAQQAAAAAPPTASTSRAPVASSKAIRQLPTIRVAPEDLVEPTNRECCICLEENKLGDRVTRLPCAHIYHSGCVVDWLTNHSCTCPVCRYELATDDPQYEAGRKERMKTRKPRYALYELERMSVQQLLALFRTPPRGICEKADLIQLLIDEERIHIIRAPKPVEYELETLQAMRISELKRVMENAGVFFHAKDVVEKSDMVTIFRNSGRLNLLPATAPEVKKMETNNQNLDISKDTNSGGVTVPARNLNPDLPVVETVDEDLPDKPMSVDTGDADFQPIEMFAAENTSPLDGRAPASETQTDNCLGTQQNDNIGQSQQNNTQTVESQEPAPQTEDDDDECLDQEEDDPMDIDWEAESTDFVVVAGPGSENQHVPSSASPETNLNESTQHESETSPSVPAQNQHSIPGEESETSRTPAQSDPHATDDSPQSTRSTGSSSSSSCEALDNSHTTEPETDSATIDGRKRKVNEIPDAPASRETNDMANDSALGAAPTTEQNTNSSQFQQHTIAQLQSMCRDAGIDSSQCFERRDLIALLSEAGVDSSNPGQICRSDLSYWSVSQLRAFSSVVNIDLSQCRDQEEMVDKILREVNSERRYLQSYLRALSPLAESSVSQLRGIARGWKVDISDCLEKDEIINRLISKGPAARR